MRPRDLMGTPVLLLLLLLQARRSVVLFPFARQLSAASLLPLRLTRAPRASIGRDTRRARHCCTRPRDLTSQRARWRFLSQMRVNGVKGKLVRSILSASEKETATNSAGLPRYYEHENRETSKNLIARTMQPAQ